MLSPLLIQGKRLINHNIHEAHERQSGSDLDFSLNVLMRAPESKNIKGDRVLEIWDRDITRIRHSSPGSANTWRS